MRRIGQPYTYFDKAEAFMIACEKIDKQSIIEKLRGQIKLESIFRFCNTWFTIKTLRQEYAALFVTKVYSADTIRDIFAAVACFDRLYVFYEDERFRGSVEVRVKAAKKFPSGVLVFVPLAAISGSATLASSARRNVMMQLK